MSAKGKTDTIIHESEDSGAGRAVVDPDIPIASQGDSIYPAIFIMGGSAGGVFRVKIPFYFCTCSPKMMILVWSYVTHFP